MTIRRRDDPVGGDGLRDPPVFLLEAPDLHRALLQPGKDCTRPDRGRGGAPHRRGYGVVCRPHRALPPALLANRAVSHFTIDGFRAASVSNIATPCAEP